MERLMSINLPRKVINDVIGTITSCGGKWQNRKKKMKNPNQRYMGNNWRYSNIDIGRGKPSSTFNVYVQRLVYIYTTEKQMNQFAIGYMINPSLHINNVFREQVENS